MGAALAVGSTPALTGEAVAGMPDSPDSPTSTAKTADHGGGGLTEAEALAKAKKTGEPVEVVSLRGEASEVFATPDGRLQAREHLRPVWTRVNGGWKRIDTDLMSTGEGTIAP
nr:hypothetical protein [Actinospica acidiphila]